jgi:hypothetical protein
VFEQIKRMEKVPVIKATKGFSLQQRVFSTGELI